MNPLALIPAGVVALAAAACPSPPPPVCGPDSYQPSSHPGWAYVELYKDDQLAIINPIDRPLVLDVTFDFANHLVQQHTVQPGARDVFDTSPANGATVRIYVDGGYVGKFEEC